MSALVVRRPGHPSRRQTGLTAAPVCLDARPDGRRWFPAAFVAELLERDAGHFDVDVNTIQQRAGQALLVAADHHRAARAGVFGVAPVTARTRILRADQHEIRREGQAALRAADGDDPVLQRLAQHLQAMLPELRHLVQEEHAAVRQADLAGPRPLPAADQPGVRDGVVRRAEGPVADQRDVAGQHAGDGVDARDVQRLGGGHARAGSRGASARAASCRSRADRTLRRYGRRQRRPPAHALHALDPKCLHNCTSYPFTIIRSWHETE